MNINDLKEITLLYIKARQPVMWWGPPGVGKTDAAWQIGAALGRHVHDWRTNLRDPVDARGLPVADLQNNVARWLRPNDLPFEGSEFPDDTILFLDEINAGNPSMQAVAMQLVHERRIGEHRLKPGVDIIAAGNRLSDRGVAQRMPTTLANRFAHLEVEPDTEAVIVHANATGWNPMVVVTLRLRPELVHQMPEKDPRAFPTPRAWEAVSRIADAPEKLRFAAVAGIVGDGPAAEFEAVARVFSKIPPIEIILNAPDTTPVPDDLSARYAIATAIARHARPQNFAAVIKYADRMPKEFGVLAVVDAVRRDATLTACPAYVDWSIRNKEVLW